MVIACVVGARPNFMKIKPVMDAFRAQGVEPSLIHTGQHYDALMSEIFLEELGLDQPTHSLGVGSGTHAEQTARTMLALEPLLHQLSPDTVVVVGDVNSTLAAALVAAKMPVTLAHVEAGLRSRDLSMPEEINRIVTDRVSDFLFAPSRDAVDNLIAEGSKPSAIHLVGNVMIDTLKSSLARATQRPILKTLGLQANSYGLVTLHRASNVDSAKNLIELIDALEAVSRELPIVFPVHPRTRKQISTATFADSIILVEPLGYLDFVALEAQARLVITDSGGVQEETTYLGIPCLTVRDNTERPITLSQGTNRLVGSDPVRLLQAVQDVLEDPPKGRIPELWDGQAGERIAQILLA